MDIVRTHPHPALRVVDLQLAEAEYSAAGRHGGQCGPLHPAQQHVDPGRQLTHGERLGHVVVGADAETDEHVGLVVPGGQHQYRHRALGLHAAADLQAVEAGKHDVEHHQIRLPGLGRVHGRRAVERGLHQEALGPQPGGNGIDDRGVVLDHQHAALCARGGRDTCVGGVCLFHRPAPARFHGGHSPGRTVFAREFLG